MPIERIPESDLTYYLISYDSDGHERTNDPDGMMSVRASEELVTTPVTDVFLISHGWLGDIPWARHQYNTWIRAMDKCKTDKERIRQARPGFKPLLIGLHWPSLPWGEEEL